MRGQGRVFRPTWRDNAGERQTSPYWSLDYSLHGVRYKEKTRLTSQRQALKLLAQRLDARSAGTLVGNPEDVLLAEYDADKKLVGGLRGLHETQYDLDGLRSKERVQQYWAHLEKFFGAGATAASVTPLRLDAYAKKRLEQGAARQTVNNELSALRRGFRLAVKKGLLATVPNIELPKVDNAREGFFEDDDFAAILLELPAHLQPVIKLLRVTGWRVNEALRLTWDRVDWERQGIRLPGRETKAKKGKLFPFGAAADLKAVLDAAWQQRNGLCVFQVNGERIGYTTLLHQWQKARKRAGCPGRIIHDLRRTAVRDFLEAGVDEGTIMLLCGWETRVAFERYRIIRQGRLEAAVAMRFTSANGKVTAKSEPSTVPPATVSSSAA
jgi:integrase